MVFQHGLRRDVFKGQVDYAAGRKQHHTPKNFRAIRQKFMADKGCDWTNDH